MGEISGPAALGAWPASGDGDAGQAHHIVPMARTHPHAEASYQVISRPSGDFSVEVSIPDSNPTTVSSFASEADAAAWIARHKSRVEAQSSATGWFRRQGSRAGPPGGRG